jgi:ribonuclease VapC
VIVIDTSVLAAIYGHEPDALALYQIVAGSRDRLLPASCLVEFQLLSRLGGDRRTWLAAFLEAQSIATADIDKAVADIAADAAERYGRGSGHPAGLNFGDCLSYAVAKHLAAPLLYKGGDFHHTDIESALPR